MRVSPFLGLLLLAGCSVSDDPLVPLTDASNDTVVDAPMDGGDAADATDAGPSSKVFCTGEVPVAVPQGVGFVASTTHYAVYDEVSAADAVESARLLEASAGAFAAWFARPWPLANGERAAVKIYKDETAWKAALSADGITPPVGSAGWYSPTTKVAYLYVQGNPYYSHVLTVHEASHQYHWLSRIKGPSLPFWYMEGIAEHLSRHDWDGSCVRLGVTSLLSWEDLPAKVSGTIDVPGIVNGSVTPSRADAFALVRYLDTGPLSSSFAAFRDAFDATGTASFSGLVTDPSTLAAPLAAWLPSVQEPMKPVFTEWVHVSSTRVLVDTPSVFSIAVLKTTPTHLDAKLEVPKSGKFAAGVVVAYQDSTHYLAIVQADDGTVRTFSANGSAQWATLGTAPGPVNQLEVVGLDLGGGQASATFNGKSFTLTSAYPLRAGLAANDTTGRFVDVAWK